MSSNAEKKFRRELNAGITSLVLLAAIHRHESPMYGYEIASHLETVTGEDLPVTPGALYPVLRSLEASGLLRSNTRSSGSGPPRKYFSLTAAGKRALKEWTRRWKTTRSIVEAVLHDDDRTTRDRQVS